MTPEVVEIIRRDWTFALNQLKPVRLAWVPNPPVLPVGALWMQDNSGDPEDWPSMVLVWTSPEARLKAWASVGCPVYAPRENNEPTLAEWIAVCESLDMLYKPARGHDAHICFISSAKGPIHYAAVHIHSAASVFFDIANVDDIAVTTPADLHKQLSALRI